MIYCLLVFVNFGIDDTESDDNSVLQQVVLYLTYVELSILILFAIEIMGNTYVYGIKVIIM